MITKVSFISLSVLLLSSWSAANAARVECEIHTGENQSRFETIDTNHLIDCDFIRKGTICDYHVEDNERFYSYNFDPEILEGPRAGDQFIGVYLTGLVNKTWEATSEEFMNCVLK